MNIEIKIQPTYTQLSFFFQPLYREFLDETMTAPRTFPNRAIYRAYQHAAKEMKEFFNTHDIEIVDEMPYKRSDPFNKCHTFIIDESSSKLLKTHPLVRNIIEINY